MYWLLFLLCILISLGAQSLVQKAYNKYISVNASCGLSGAEAASKFMRDNGVYDVIIELGSSSSLSDAYDPTRKTIRLSRAVYSGTSIAAIAVACHEAGHAIQHAKNYKALVVRNKMLPIVNISNRFCWLILLVGIIFSIIDFINIGLILFGVVALFQLVTLPVEFNASNRALNYLENESYILNKEETDGAQKVLTSAALTYVASLLVSLIQLFRLVLIFGGRRR